MVINHIIDTACLGGVCICEILEIEPFVEKLLFTHVGFAFRIEFLEYATVAAKSVVDVAHKAHLLVVLIVIVAVTAVIVAEFLVGTAIDRLTAV